MKIPPFAHSYIFSHQVRSVAQRQFSTSAPSSLSTFELFARRMQKPGQPSALKENTSPLSLTYAPQIASLSALPLQDILPTTILEPGKTVPNIAPLQTASSEKQVAPDTSEPADSPILTLEERKQMLQQTQKVISEATSGDDDPTSLSTPAQQGKAAFNIPTMQNLSLDKQIAPDVEKPTESPALTSEDRERLLSGTEKVVSE